MVRYDIEGETFNLQIAGEININSLAGIRAKIDNLNLSQYKRIIIDLSRVTFLDSSGMGYLVVLVKQARVNQIEIKLRNPGQLVRRMLAMSRIDRYVEIEDTTVKNPSEPGRDPTAGR